MQKCWTEAKSASGRRTLVRAVLFRLSGRAEDLSVFEG